MDDVINIINAMPLTHKLRDAEASLFLFAVLCGARCVTCQHLQWDHITSVADSTIYKGEILIQAGLTKK
jgi:hypothetical protein